MPETTEIETVGQKPRPLLTNSAEYLEFFDRKAVVVDKTGLILELMNESSGPYFLARPRRFGKTLLLDTIQNIAEGNRELFCGTTIGKEKSGYAWKQHPVVRLSFSRFDSDPVLFRHKLLEMLDEIARDHQLSTKPAASVTDISAVIAGLSGKHADIQPSDSLLDRKRKAKNVFLLIDEYDYPLIGGIGDHGITEDLRVMLRNFYSTIKDCAPMLRLTFITGITKFQQFSFFSGLNNIVDISLNPKFSSICGFTEEEIQNNFSGNIREALSHMLKDGHIQSNSTEADFMDRLKFWYDGYTWDGETKVYNPYSVVCCLKESAFNNYWYESGISLIAHKLTPLAETYLKIFFGELTQNKFSAISDLKSVNAEVMLFLTGYLTISKIDKTGENIKYALKCPNNEIIYAIIHDFVHLNSPFPGFSGSINRKYASFIDAFDESDSNECARIFSSFLGEIVLYLHHPDEFTFQSLLYLLLNVRNKRAELEMHAGEGRADIIYSLTNKCKVVVEMKYDKTKLPVQTSPELEPVMDGASLPGFLPFPENVLKILEDNIALASEQILRKKYLAPYYESGLEVRACAVAIHGLSDVMFRFFPVVWKDVGSGPND
ncbi:MAG: AAA family ATPase [Deltaproteobacteria bacterium]|nr:AAA family ATPase [Deltaproteobacteria bacterium]